jgi:hypothetical protein
MHLKILLATIAISGCAAKSSAPVAIANTPAANRIQVCVIDPVVPGGMMTVSAIHPAGTADTLVLQANGRVPIEKITAGSKVWRSGTLQLTTGSGRVRFAPSGKPRVFVPGKITLLGMIGSVTVFANPADAGPIRPQIEALAARGKNLEQALQSTPALRRQMSKVRTLYMPTSLVNCEFQTFKR